MIHYVIQKEPYGADNVQIAILTDLIRKNTKIDWDKKQSARAYIRTQVKHLLRKYKYPPEQAKDAIDTVIQQAELMSSIEVGDSVLTSSGFYGMIIDITDDVVIVEFGSNKNCRIPMQKSAIVQVEKPGQDA